MIIDIGKFNKYETPHRFGYCPFDKYWYQNKDILALEPKTQPDEVDNFVVEDILGSKDKTIVENEQKLQDFIAYNFGVETNTNEYSFSLFNFPKSNISIEIELWNFAELKIFIQEIEKGENITRYCDRISAIKFYAWQKENNTIRFALQKYIETTNNPDEDFVFIYDAIVDKTQLVNELKRVLEKYTNRLVEEIRRYERQNNVEFTNVRKNIDLAEILDYKFEELSDELEREREENPKVGDVFWLGDSIKIEVLKVDEEKPVKKIPTYKDWTAKKFTTASELEEFLNKVKPQLINQPLNNIIITGKLFGYENTLEYYNGKYYMLEWCGTDENNNAILDYQEEEDYNPDDYLENYCAELDEPAILVIGETQFEINMSEFSLAQIGINTLKEGLYVSDYGEQWQSINKHFEKNLIGHKVKDIYITKTSQPDITREVPRQDGDDMYEEIVFVFDHDYKLKIDVSVDYMNITEVKPDA